METDNLQTQGADDSSTSSKLGEAEAPLEGMAEPVEVPPVPLSNSNSEEQTDVSSEVKQEAPPESAPLDAEIPESEAEAKEAQPSSSQAPTAPDAPAATTATVAKKHMSGAALRRMKHYLRIGLSREEARIKAQTPYKLPRPMMPADVRPPNGSQSLPKWKVKYDRHMSRVKSGMTWQKKAKDIKRYQLEAPVEISFTGGEAEEVDEAPPAFDEVDDEPLAFEDRASIKLGIGLVGFPFDMLSMEQVEMIKQAILDHIIAESGAMKPTFNKLLYKNGWLSLSCANAATAQWMRATFHKLNIWPGGRLRILDDSECYRFIFRGFFPNSQSQDDSKILSLIAAQNKIDTTQWKVIGRQPTDKDGFLFLAVEPSTIDKLQRRKFTLNFGFGRVKLKDTLKGIEECVRGGQRQPPMPHPSGWVPPRAQFPNAGPRWRAPQPKLPSLTEISPWGSKPSPWAHNQPRPWMTNDCGPWANKQRANGPWANTRAPFPNQQPGANRFQFPPSTFNGPPQEFRGNPKGFKGPKERNPVWQPPAYQRRPENDWQYPPRNY